MAQVHITDANNQLYDTLQPSVNPGYCEETTLL